MLNGLEVILLYLSGMKPRVLFLSAYQIVIMYVMHSILTKACVCRRLAKMEVVGAAKVSKPIRQPKSTESVRGKTQRARPRPERATAKGVTRHHRLPSRKKPQTPEEKMQGKPCPKLPLKSLN